VQQFVRSFEVGAERSRGTRELFCGEHMHLSTTPGIVGDSARIDNLDRASRSPRSSARAAPFGKKSQAVVIRASNGASISLVRVPAASR
jgi:hypothetical protein